MIKTIKGYSKNGETILWTSKDKPIEGSFGFKNNKKYPSGLLYIYFKKKWNKIK